MTYETTEEIEELAIVKSAEQHGGSLFITMKANDDIRSEVDYGTLASSLYQSLRDNGWYVWSSSPSDNAFVMTWRR